MVAARQVPAGRNRSSRRVRQAENSAQRTAILATLIAVANEVGATPGEVAIAWVAAKGSLPIIGPRKVAPLESNLASIKVALSVEQIARLDEVGAVAPIFPHAMLDVPETWQGYAGGRAEQFVCPSSRWPD
ncbi:aldo/keto reductase [Paraburkholderia caballeronis]|uniref:aldo/keto reductase n=1 Tax=Paraburkholderia caballeronis TaxID=416943 RepID=UPI00313986E2